MQKQIARFALAFALVCAFIRPPCAHATTVLSPKFDTMVRRAELIFTGRTTAQRSEWRNIDGQRSIVTIVTFEVLGLHKGSAGRTVELQFLGGKVGDAELRVDLMPKFNVGERAVLFVENNGVQASPLVGFCHGKLNVQSDDSIATYDGTPLNDVNEIGKPHGKHDGVRGMSRKELVSKISAALQKGKQ